MRYFFHLHNDLQTFDEEGVEFAHESDAREHALGEARTMAADSVSRGHLDLGHFIEVADRDKTTLFRVTFGEAVRIMGSA